MLLAKIHNWGEFILLGSFFIVAMLYYKWISKFKKWLADRKKKKIRRQ